MSDETFRAELAAAHARIGRAHRTLVEAFDAEAEILQRASDTIGAAAIALPRLTYARHGPSVRSEVLREIFEVLSEATKRLSEATKRLGNAATWSDER